MEVKRLDQRRINKLEANAGSRTVNRPKRPNYMLEAAC